MKAWLSRAVTGTVLRGEDRHNRIARWSRWFPVTPAVDEARFQDADDPYPGHWREFPPPWRHIVETDPTVRHRLAEAVTELPTTWRRVLALRDVQGRSPAEVSAKLEVSREQERALLNRARAFLRERLAQLLSRDGAR